MRITVILAAVALAAAGCSSSTSKPPAPAAAAAAGSAPAAAASSPSAPASTAAAVKLKVGATATLTTPSGPLEVTIVKLVDPAKPKESYIYPTKGEHWIGVQLKLVNKGTTAFVDSPLLGLDAADAQGQPQNSFPDQEIAAGPMIDPLAGVRVEPGDTTLGYLVYSVPDGTKLARFTFAPPGSSAAQWTLS